MYEIKLIADYWRVLKDGKLVATFKTYREAESFKAAVQH